MQRGGKYIGKEKVYKMADEENFSRRSAIRTLCDNSHCTVAYTPEEFELLIEFIKEKIG